jgi:hypothetical protein
MNTPITMDQDTDYVHTAMVNYEPTYLILERAARGYLDSRLELWEARDMVTDAVEQHADAMGLRPADLLNVDYAVIIQWEVEHSL